MVNDPHVSADILVVEDSETQANQLAHLLSSNGYRVRIANNGWQALEQARAQKPTLIVSDIAMPEMDGYAMCRELKKDGALNNVPVILLTALTSLYDVIKGLDCGADNFIRKPVEGRYLLGRIRFILANRELRSNEKVQLGMQISLGGQTHFVTAERQQIFDLLISTYEEAIQMTEELREQQTQIAHSYQSLEGLYKIAEALNPVITEQAVAEMALDRALDLPGVLGGCVMLLGADGQFHAAAVRDFGTTQGAATGCARCTCRDKLVAGQLHAVEVIADCELLRGAPGSPPTAHVSIPLAVGERTLGVMNLIGMQDAVPRDEDIHVLDTVGNQIAIALERARLYTNMEALVQERTEALAAERNRLSAVVNTTGALVLLVDPEGRIVTFNPACERSLGWICDEVIGRVFWEVLLQPHCAEAAKAFFSDINPDALDHQERQEWVARDGSIRHIIWSTSALKRPDRSVEYFLATGLDVTELRRAEEQVQYLSNFDIATGLPNRILLRDRVRLARERIAAGTGIMGFLVIHLARLPLLRESLGAQAELEILQQMANRMKEWAKGEDTVARYGDDSFAVVAVRQEPNHLSVVARQILALLNRPLAFQQQELQMEASVGITLCPNDGDDFDALALGAEMAMRRAQAGKMDRYEFYRPELNRGAFERFKFESALRRALDRGELLLHYQPQVDLRTGEIIGLEALVRWQSPEFGLVPPGRFIGLAEEIGLILPIGEWVLRQACEQNRAWQREGLRIVPVAVNLSTKQFSKNIVQTVRDILKETGLEPSMLELEMTESMSMDDPENTFEILRTLKEMGVRLAIDDFGTGYSNLNYLKRFPVDKLKLDQSFVRELIFDPDDLSISRAVVAMAHSLRLRVIAEGVETEGQLALLAKNDCDEMQGYFFSKPVDAMTCAQLLQERKALAVDELLRRSYERTLLFIDEEVNLGAAIQRTMRGNGYRIFVTTSAPEAFEILATHDVGVILCDQRMLGMNGTEFLSRVKQMYPAVVRMVLVAGSDLRSIADAAGQEDIFKIIRKPWGDEELLAAIGNGFVEFESKRTMPARHVA